MRRRLGMATMIALAVVLLAALAVFVGRDLLPVWQPAALRQFAEVEGGPPLRRGVGVHNILNWADLSDDKAAFAWPPFAHADHQLSDGLIGKLKRAGFDFVRLTVDPGPFLLFTGERRDQLDEILLSTVKRFSASGLDVVVDFHPNRQVPAYAPDRLVAGDETSPLFRDYVAMVARTARLLAPLDLAHVALEPLNEPEMGWDMLERRRWQRMLEALHAAIREAAPELLVILTGSRGGSLEGLVELDPAPFSGSRVRFSFHYYLPYDFTHQGFVDTSDEGRIWRYLGGIPYPAGRADFEAFWTIVQSRVAADRDLDRSARQAILSGGRTSVSAYFDGAATRRRIADDFDRVADWAHSHGIDPTRVFLGEFGVTRAGSDVSGALPVHREAWLNDVVAEAADRQFGWAVWTLMGAGGMEIVDDGGAALDSVTLRALGLHSESAD